GNDNRRSASHALQEHVRPALMGRYEQKKHSPPNSVCAGESSSPFLARSIFMRACICCCEHYPKCAGRSPPLRYCSRAAGRKKATCALSPESSISATVSSSLERVRHEEIPRYYDLADVSVFPRVSVRLTELVTPLKPLEAMAQERIVVASSVGGHRELIR